MTTVATLTMKIEGETQSLERSMRAVQQSTKKFEVASQQAFMKFRSAVGRATKSVFSMRGAMVAAAGAAGLGLMVKRSLDAADKIAKTADVIGITTAALQEYRFAADLAGVEQGKLDAAFKKFAKNVGELGKTSSELDTTLRDLSPTMLANLRAANGMEDALARAFRGLGAVTDAAKKAAIAQALFGRAGLGMSLIVKDGTAELEAMRQKARDLGLVIADDLLRNSEHAVDQLEILSTVVSAQATTAFIKFAPEISAVAKFLQDVAMAGEWVFDTFRDDGAKSLKGLQGELDGTTAKIADLIAEIVKIDAALKQQGFAGSPYLSTLHAELGKLEARAIELEKLIGKKITPITTTRDVGAAPGVVSPSLTTGKDVSFDPGLLGRTGPTSLFRAAQEAGLGPEQETALKFWERSRRLIEETRTPLEQYRASLAQVDELFKAGFLTVEQYDRAVKGAAETFTSMDVSAQAAIQKSEAAMAESARRMEGFALDMGRSFETVFDRIIGGATDSRAILIGLIQDMSKALINLTTGGQGLFGAAFSNLFGGAGAGAGAVKAGKGFQHGGSFEVGGRGGTDASLVAFNATRGEHVTVTPAGQSSGRGAVTVNQSFDMRGADAGTFANAKRWGEQIKQETLGAVLDLMNQGGAMSRASGRRRGR